MGKIFNLGPPFLAVTTGAFGVLYFVWARFGDRMFPIIPWVPAKPVLIYLTGTVLIAGGLAIASGLGARASAVFLGLLFLACALFLHLHKLFAHPYDLGIRTQVFETLALCAGFFTLAGILPRTQGAFSGSGGVVGWCIRGGPVLFGVSMVLFGVDHFLLLPFIASLVPAWIPGHMFWAYFTGAAFVAAGIAIALNRMARLAGTLLGLLFLLIFLCLHAPRVLTAPRSHNPNEWSSAFIAFGMCAVSWICAAYSGHKRRHPAP